MIQNKKFKEKRKIVVYKYDSKSLVAIAILHLVGNIIAACFQKENKRFLLSFDFATDLRVSR